MGQWLVTTQVGIDMETGPAILYHLQQSQSLPVKKGAT